MFAHALVLAVLMAVQSSSQPPPRDPKLSRPPSASPDAVIIEIQKLTESGDLERAEALLDQARAANPKSIPLLNAASAFYNRKGDFPKTMEALELVERLTPRDREAAYRVAVFYWEKAFRDTRLDVEAKRQYLAAGVAASDRALAI